MLHQLNYVCLKVRYIDGGKIESVAGRYTFVGIKNGLNKLNTTVRARLFSEKGLNHRGKRPIEVEAVFG